MPFLVMAGLKKHQRGSELKKDRQVAHTKLHYVQGELHVPKSFGAPFEFSILRGGTFDEIKQAAASYVKILLHGALLAEKIKTTKNYYPSAMLCSCQHKMNGWSIDNCNLIASPILNENRFSVITRVHQGELFRVVLSRQFLMDNCDFRIWVAREVAGASDLTNYHVVIKVSSLTVHKTLVLPYVTENAFLRSTDVSALEESVLCLWRPSPISLVTVMRDLSVMGFYSLKPYLCVDFAALWSGFCDLVERVLLPLALKNVVHCDIRPGWDQTYNIMMNWTAEGTLLL